MLELEALPLDADLYAPFGEVVRANPTPPRSCNHGTAQAWDSLATLRSTRPAAQTRASLFRCDAHTAPTLEVRWLERHPHSTQLFAPLGQGAYLLVVAGGEQTPDLRTLRAFTVRGATAITYHPGIWHHPMVALGDRLDFLNLLASDGTDADCEEREFSPPCARVAIA